MKRIVLITTGMLPLHASVALAGDGVAISVPEPSTILLLGIAIACLGLFFFWKSKKK